MFGMELWFVYAIAGAFIGGFAAFTGKIAAHRHYNSELTILVSTIIPLAVLYPLALMYSGIELINPLLFIISFSGGVVAALSGIFRIYAMRYIDTTIFFPIFKVVSPLWVIFFGIMFFSESFTLIEVFGLFVSLTVPLMLITKSEHIRQNNLVKGLLLIMFTGLMSALAAVFQKYATNLFDATLWIVLSTIIGILTGSFIIFVIKNSLRNAIKICKSELSIGLVKNSIWRGILLPTSFFLTLLAYEAGGSLGIVYTINSLYILIPIVLSIVIYKEHWNMRKVVAIILSIVALAFLK